LKIIPNLSDKSYQQQNFNQKILYYYSYEHISREKDFSGLKNTCIYKKIWWLRGLEKLGMKARSLNSLRCSIISTASIILKQAKTQDFEKTIDTNAFGGYLCLNAQRLNGKMMYECIKKVSKVTEKKAQKNPFEKNLLSITLVSKTKLIFSLTPVLKKTLHIYKW